LLVTAFWAGRCWSILFILATLLYNETPPDYLDKAHVERPGLIRNRHTLVHQAELADRHDRERERQTAELSSAECRTERWTELGWAAS
jgi:hypothetical protein